MGIDEILNQYKAKIQELLKISQNLGDVRKQKLAAEDDLKRRDAEIMDIKSRAAATSKPEEKKECDDLISEAVALKGQSENLLKIATENEKAFAIFKAAAQGGSEKDRLANYYFLGITYHQNKQLPEAIAALEESLKHRESARELTAFVYTYACYGSLGQAYLDNSQYQQAGSNFLNAANVTLNISRIKSDLWNPDPATWERKAGYYYGLLGRAHVLDTSYQEAVSPYQKAMELDPMNGLHYSGLALAYVGLKQYDDALAAARRGVEFASNSQASHANLGDVHAARREYDQAIDAYRKAVEVAPRQLEADQENQEKTTGPLSQKVYDQLRGAVNMVSAGFYVKSSQMSVAKGNYAGAVEAINKAAELTPNNPDIYYRLGMIHARAAKDEIYKWEFALEKDGKK